MNLKKKLKEMDKAISREGLVNAARKLYKGGWWESERLDAVLEEMFPELKESEDERIRKILIKRVRTAEELNEELRECIIAYLEKRKDHISSIDAICLSAGIPKPYKDGNQWCILKGDNIQDGIAGFGNTEEDALVDFIRNVPIEKQKETVELVYRMNGLMQEYVESGKDEEEQKHRLKCYQLFWAALRDSEFYEQKEQKPVITGDDVAWIDDLKHDLEHPEELDEKVQEALKKRQKPAVEQQGGTFNSYDMAKTFAEGQYYVMKHPEKFGLCKPAEWSEEDERMLSRCIKSVECSKQFADSESYKAAKDVEINWLKSLSERFNLPPKQEWSEDWREEDIQTRFAFYTYKDDPSTLYLSNVFVEEASRNYGFGTRILRAAEKVAETIGATTISLKVKQDSPANAWYRKNGYGYVTFEDGYDWLEKNLEYMKPTKSAEWSDEDKKMIERLTRILELGSKGFHADYTKKGYAEALSWLKSICPQPKAEWSEEDEKTRKTLLDYYEKALDNYTCVEWLNGITYGELCDWLKSLPSRFSIQPHWKPSEEQMEVFGEFILPYGTAHEKIVLNGLYNELKKL